jgi:hypothetical protein
MKAWVAFCYRGYFESGSSGTGKERLGSVEQDGDTSQDTSPVDGISRDLAALARRLPHRGSNTDCEREAAEYIRSRMEESSGNAILERFPNPDNFGVLFGSYYAEFAVVTLIAWWSPLAAFVYGVLVFGCYLAEFTGYNVMARFLPAFESQNVVAHMAGIAPRATLIVTANYDTGRAGSLYKLAANGTLHWAHRLVVYAMFTILLTCLLEVARAVPPEVLQWVPSVRTGVLGVCLVAALGLFFTETTGDYVSGAVGNASGVAGLLALADRLRERPLPWADVYLVATGGKETWMRGMCHFLRGQEFDRHTSFFLNLTHVGAGTLGYTTGEGLLHLFPASPPMLMAARESAVGMPAAAIRLRAAPTDALIPLARGYHAMSVVGLNEHNSLPFWRSHADTVLNVDESKIRRAADFAEAVLRRLERTL